MSCVYRESCSVWDSLSESTMFALDHLLYLRASEQSKVIGLVSVYIYSVCMRVQYFFVM